MLQSLHAANHWEQRKSTWSTYGSTQFIHPAKGRSRVSGHQPRHVVALGQREKRLSQGPKTKFTLHRVRRDGTAELA